MNTYNKKKIKGATMIEYVLIVGLISIAAVTIITTLGGTIKTVFTAINTSVGTA